MLKNIKLDIKSLSLLFNLFESVIIVLEVKNLKFMQFNETILVSIYFFEQLENIFSLQGNAKLFR